MSRLKGSSRRWIDEHRRDPFVKRAHAEGRRSRAFFKLEEIADRGGLFAPGMVVIDLGAAPGGWSEVAAARIAPSGRVLAVDLLSMPEIPGVEAIVGDFSDPRTEQALRAELGNRAVSVVMSDMAPNMSGVRSVDQAQAMNLAELALTFALQVLQPGGAFVVKAFQGEGFDGFLRAARSAFTRVSIRKPAASRARSREQYLVASGLVAAGRPGSGAGV